MRVKSILFKIIMSRCLETLNAALNNEIEYLAHRAEFGVSANEEIFVRQHTAGSNIEKIQHGR